MLVYVVSDFRFSPLCEVFEVSRLGNYRELWVWCENMHGVLRLLEQVSSLGSVLAFGGLAGIIRKSLPATRDEFLKFALGEVILGKGSRIVVEALSPRIESVKPLIDVSSKLQINLRDRNVKATLTKPVSTKTLFDNKLRLLKPLEAPPKLIGAHPR